MNLSREDKPAGQPAAAKEGAGVANRGKGEGKRQRLTTETREQLLERIRNPLLNLDEAAIILRVCKATVRRYADSGLLPHVRTPGGQRRFYYRDIEAFYRQLMRK